MIEESVKIHDKFSLEIKLGFVARKKQRVSDFVVNTWLFIPNSLDINPLTYQKGDFYRDLKSNIRIITPVFLLRDIAGHKNSPFPILEKSFENLASNPSRSHTADYEYHIKMFLSILKSALRNDISHIIGNSISEDRAFLLNGYVENIEKIITKYRNLRRIINASTISKEQFNFYQFGDEFMSNIIEQHTFKLLASLDKSKQKDIGSIRKKIIQIVHHGIEYRQEKGFPVVDKKDAHRNRDLIFRLGLLKKFAENELFLTTNKKKDGVLVEQVYYSLAAGISMVFATAIAFSFQIKYGNFTMPFFVALVVSYMLKDRIKDLGRYYFAYKLGRRYFDHKTRITLKENIIGWSKEGMDFITEDKVPADVIKIRDRSPILEANNRAFSEKIILYRQLVHIIRAKLDQSIQYNTSGINDIIRFNISSFTNKMDNSDFPLYITDDNDEVKVIMGKRTYYLNLIMQLKNEDQLTYKRYRIVFNREGIVDIERF
jgi:PHD/YefM family antitoxin component YafN of YafNO toxin-antitoxin module